MVQWIVQVPSEPSFRAHFAAQPSFYFICWPLYELTPENHIHTCNRRWFVNGSVMLSSHRFHTDLHFTKLAALVVSKVCLPYEGQTYNLVQSFDTTITIRKGEKQWVIYEGKGGNAGWKYDRNRSTFNSFSISTYFSLLSATRENLKFYMKV
jgi:hypothetical protein